LLWFAEFYIGDLKRQDGFKLGWAGLFTHLIVFRILR
jgi:hypothetical protein